MWQGRRPSRWRRVASASRSAGRPPRKVQARPRHPGPSAQRGGRTAARAQLDSPVCTLRMAGSRRCTRPRRKEAWPREPGNGEGGEGEKWGTGVGRRGGRGNGGGGEKSCGKGPGTPFLIPDLHRRSASLQRTCGKGTALAGLSPGAPSRK